MKRASTIILFLVLSNAALFSACRVSPEPGSSEPKAVPDVPTSPTAPSTDVKAPKSPELSNKPAKEIIARVLPESLIAPPTKSSASSSVDYNTLIATRSPASQQKSGWRYRTTRRGEIVGFEFSNYGGNRILPPRRDASKNQFYSRDFQFRFDERARQDIHLMISDWVPSRDRVFHLSEIMLADLPCGKQGKIPRSARLCENWFGALRRGLRVNG